MIKKKKNKRWLFVIFSILTVLSIAYLFAQWVVKNKIEKVLTQDMASNLTITYNDLALNLFLGNVSLYQVRLVPKDAALLKSTVEIEQLSVKGFSYFELLKTGNIKMDAPLLEHVTGEYFKNKTTEKNSSKTEKATFDKLISIANFSLKNTNFTSFNTDNDSVLLAVKNLDLSLKNLRYDATSIQSKIPIKYDAYHINSGKIIASISDFETIKIDSIYKNRKLYIAGFSLKSKYDRQTLQTKISKERDYIYLNIPTIEISGFDIGAHKDASLVKAKSVLMQNLYLEMYRNKLMPDDLKQKLLFDKKVRNLAIKIDILNIEIKNGEVNYSELIKENAKAGEIIFTEVYSTIQNVSNLNKNPIIFKNTAKLMGEAPISLEWTFYTEANHNLFKVYGIIKNFNASEINSFMSSNLRATSSGTIEELYFTISGDANASTGDIKMKYEDFKFQVLTKDRSGVNEISTAVGNIFTNDGSNADKNGYRYGSIQTERDDTKSFFNYVWKNVSDGLVSTLTGNGEKEKQ